MFLVDIIIHLEIQSFSWPKQTLIISYFIHTLLAHKPLEKLILKIKVTQLFLHHKAFVVPFICLEILFFIYAWLVLSYTSGNSLYVVL